ncbi:metallophosphoesterase family protein [Pseudomonas entomophila]|uniref:metallophosphoesterase family protein n=1 Tax=Pseudomonas entomophila TaxID=312306 RepID=UPI0015E29429|nr:metallophosphoesterase family protein [Pseudomonas entomophila]MBA1194958.1 metallophosphoesterase family protein [Pseudomonas entomophila]
MRLGLISDTHGLLRPEALAALDGCDLILHAGDIGKAEILTALSALAPVQVVRGNNDQQAPWASDIADHLLLSLDGIETLLVHDIADVPPLLSDTTRLVITGHSHKPLFQWRGERLFINPGSAGPRRFKLPVTVALLELSQVPLTPQRVNLLP